MHASMACFALDVTSLWHKMQIEGRKWFQFSLCRCFALCMEVGLLFAKGENARIWRENTEKNCLSILGLPSGWAESDYAGVWSDHLVKLVLCGFVYVISASSELFLSSGTLKSVCFFASLEFLPSWRSNGFMERIRQISAVCWSLQAGSHPVGRPSSYS